MCAVLQSKLVINMLFKRNEMNQFRVSIRVRKLCAELKQKKKKENPNNPMQESLLKSLRQLLGTSI